MGQPWRTLMEYEVPSIAGSERAVMERAAAAARNYLPPAALERLETAVSEAVMNAIEHGNQGQVDRLVRLRVRARPGMVQVSIQDQGSGRSIPAPAAPNLESKLSGDDSPRGWGLFLIQHMADDVRVENGAGYHTMVLTFLAGEGHNERKTP